MRILELKTFCDRSVEVMPDPKQVSNGCYIYKVSRRNLGKA